MHRKSQRIAMSPCLKLAIDRDEEEEGNSSCQVPSIWCLISPLWADRARKTRSTPWHRSPNAPATHSFSNSVTNGCRRPGPGRYIYNIYIIYRLSTDGFNNANDTNGTEITQKLIDCIIHFLAITTTVTGSIRHQQRLIYYYTSL